MFVCSVCKCSSSSSVYSIYNNCLKSKERFRGGRREEGTEGSTSGEGIVAVDPHCPGPRVVRNGERRLQVLRDDARCEAVCGPVGALDDVGCVFEFDDGHDRAEDLLLGDRHVVLYVGEHRRLNEEALVTDRLACSTPHTHTHNTQHTEK